MSKGISRKRFLIHAFAGVAGISFAPFALGQGRKLSPNDRLNIGIIGVAHQGEYNLNNVASENIVALCDIAPPDNTAATPPPPDPSASAPPHSHSHPAPRTGRERTPSLNF